MIDAAETRVRAAIARHWPQALEDIRSAIRQPSVSRTGEGLQAMADWLCGYLARLGASVRQVPGQRAPIIEGELSAGADRPTLLFYELYDVQPAQDQPGWSVPPFAAAVETDDQGRRRLIGRGAFNSKGPLLGALATLRCFAQADMSLPCNIRFLIEGEEEIGSPSLPDYIAMHREQLARCDAAFIPYFGTNARGQTLLRLGFKGLALLELSVSGGDWGGPARGDVHALHGALVESPNWHLLRALQCLLDDSGCLAVPGLDALVPPADARDRALLRAAVQRFDPAEYAAEIGVRRLKSGSAEALLHDLLFTCTLNIDALRSGRIETGGQAATLIPRLAQAWLDLRVVPGVQPAAVVALLRSQLDRCGLPHVGLRTHSAYPGSKVAPDSPAARALIEACRANSDDLMVLPIHAGAAPMYVFSDMIGIPYAFGGVGHGAGAHGPNEYIMVDDLAAFMSGVAGFLLRFGRLAARPGPAFDSDSAQPHS